MTSTLPENPPTGGPPPVWEPTGLARLRLTEEDFRALACQGSVITEQRRQQRPIFKLYFRRGRQQVVRYIGKDPQVAEGVREELRALQGRRHLAQKLRAITAEARDVLRETKRVLEPHVDMFGLTFHGLMFRDRSRQQTHCPSGPNPHGGRLGRNLNQEISDMSDQASTFNQHGSETSSFSPSPDASAPTDQCRPSEERRRGDNGTANSANREGIARMPVVSLNAEIDVLLRRERAAAQAAALADRAAEVCERLGKGIIKAFDAGSAQIDNFGPLHSGTNAFSRLMHQWQGITNMSLRSWPGKPPTAS